MYYQQMRNWFKTEKPWWWYPITNVCHAYHSHINKKHSLKKKKKHNVRTCKEKLYPSTSRVTSKCCVFWSANRCSTCCLLVKITYTFEINIILDINTFFVVLFHLVCSVGHISLSQIYVTPFYYMKHLLVKIHSFIMYSNFSNK